MDYLSYIINNEHFITCPLLNTGRFIKYCTERGIVTSREQLEEFEKLNLFYPLARVRHHQTYSWFRNDHAKILLRQGLIWDPALVPYQSWSTFKDEKGQRQVENFYSIFQCYPLNALLRATTLGEIRAEKWASYTNEEVNQLSERFTKRAQEILERNQTNKRAGGPSLAALLCQIISNRYFPATQSDRRTIRISRGSTKGEWDWFEYRRQWDAKSVFSDLEMDVEPLKRICQIVKLDANQTDPMEQWKEIVSFVSVDKRKQLKGSAQFAQTLRSMGLMLSGLIEELTGEGVYLFDQAPEDIDSFYGGAGVSKNNLEYLEYLANEFHLNPRPKLILVVEGEGEEEQIPRIVSEVFGLDLARCEIEIRNLRGIDNFTGDKKKDKYGALEKFIDFNHDRQTMVFALLDNESRAAEVKARLTTKPSDYFRKRTVTREEYIAIWNASIEFENFSDEEIATALTDLCNHEYNFQPSEVAPLRNSPTGNPLKNLFNNKTGGKYDLTKRTLLSKLFDPVVAASKVEFEAKKMGEKPIISVLQKVLVLANRNYQPHSRDAWTENQESGFFGHTKGEEEKRTKDFLAKSSAAGG